MATKYNSKSADAADTENTVAPAASNHPSLANTGPDVAADFRDTPAWQHQVALTAERNGISEGAAAAQILAGAEGAGEQVRPRSESGNWTKWQGSEGEDE